MLPAKYAFPVVVAPPEMVNPPTCVPLPIVDDAETMTPTVVVGASAPETRCQSLMMLSDDEETLLLNDVQSAAERQPKVPPFAVLQLNAEPSYVSPVPAVVVATHVGTPETSASTCPLVPAEVVARRDVPLPKTIEFACTAAQPVPPLGTGRSPVTSAARSISEVETTPAVALRKPLSAPSVNEFDAMRLEVEAYCEVMLVVDALTKYAVDEAKKPVRNQVGVVVAFVVVPKFVVVSHGHEVSPVLVIVIGEAPSAVKVEHETPDEQVTDVVATEPKVVRPEVLVKYPSPETAMSVVVAIWYLSFCEMVTLPVAPETVMPVPAMFERTPVLLNDVPSYESPVPAVVVATPVQPPLMKAST